MFAPWCPTCGRAVLLGTRRIVQIHRDDDDRLHLDLQCFCGRVIGSASSAARPDVRGGDPVASAAPAGLDATAPRPAEDPTPPPAEADPVPAAVA